MKVSEEPSDIEEPDEWDSEDSRMNLTPFQATNETAKNTAWTEQEHWQLIKAIRDHGQDWDKVTAQVGTRGKSEIKHHADVLR